MVFSKKWLKNYPPFLLHFLIHIDVLMLCRKFELILTRNFRVMSILKNEPILKKSKGYSPWFFPKNGSKITPNFYYIIDCVVEVYNSNLLMYNFFIPLIIKSICLVYTVVATASTNLPHTYTVHCNTKQLMTMNIIKHTLYY